MGSPKAHRGIVAKFVTGSGLDAFTFAYHLAPETPFPGAAVVMSPWTDLACSGASYAMKDPLAPEGSCEIFSRYYAGSHDLREPLISPLYGDLTGLPPLLIYVGEREAMLDDARSFAAKAERAGVDATLRAEKGMVHCFPVLAPMFPEATRAMNEICSFVEKHAGETAA